VGSAGQTEREGRALSQQPWGGRFGEEPDPLIDEFTRSLDVDSRLLREDIAGSRAWAKALVRAGVLAPEEQLRIDLALQDIAVELESDLNHPPP
jgi:argininosuccinate lyase